MGYSEDAANHPSGFTEIGGVFSDITVPGGQLLIPEAVNNLGTLVGELLAPGASLAGPSFIATPQAVPEPGAAVLLGGLLALSMRRRRRDLRQPIGEISP